MLKIVSVHSERVASRRIEIKFVRFSGANTLENTPFLCLSARLAH